MADSEMKKKHCKSVFESGEDTISNADFTKKWIEMISKTEKYQRFKNQNDNNDKENT